MQSFPTDTEAAQALLRDDVETIRRYGESCPETFAGVRFVNVPTVRLVASFAGDLARHESALRARLGHPGLVVLEEVRHSKAELEQVRDEVRALLEREREGSGRPVLTRLGVGITAVQVGLQADREALAAELVRRYGESVEVRVGAFTYPMDPARTAPVGQRESGLEPLEIAGLGLELVPERPVLEVGDHGRGAVVVRNLGSGRIGPFQSGQPLRAFLVDEDGRVVGGDAAGAIAGTGMTIDLAPGAEVRIGCVFGTASFRAELGYLLPPGRYGLRTEVDVAERPGATRRALRVPDAAITLVPRRTAG